MGGRMSEHFSIAELTRTDTGIQNAPAAEDIANLARLCAYLLEPARELLGVPIIIHSAYRCPRANGMVGGDPMSAHLTGRACDFHPGNGMDIKDAFDRLRISPLQYDKIILEHHGGSWWIHIQVAKPGAEARGKAYTASAGEHGMVYREVPNGTRQAPV